ncbi:MAG: UDP-3-O-[3-hydroxymyristoyl] N-acetylglucosamine deacetylase [Candidatus Stahlbacteria bacterium]|nr:UDP-3-O-[3-hydroxymyristoyl] N-acetylglucosamine deacetylase [Candidatus Stahlbacteria bacterium]
MEIGQTTIANPFTVEGIGVHTGEHSKLTVKPAPIDTGIVFFTKDGIKIPAVVENVNHTGNGVTLLGSNGEKIKTCEHILSAFYGLGIDNAICEISGDEVPILDGSSLEFTNLIKVKHQAGQHKNEFKVREPIFIESNSSCIFVTPVEAESRFIGDKLQSRPNGNNELKITFLIDYPQTTIKTQCQTFTITQDVYCKEIAPARTYTFANEIDKLRSKGLIKGGSLDNAVVIGDDGPINNLRFPDEQVRHKVLDFIGDISLLGVRLKGNVVAIKSGHTLNIELARRLKKWSLT